MITHGTNKPANLHTFFYPLYEEICDMSLNGIQVQTGDEIIQAKIHLLTFTGDIPAVADLINHRGHMHRSGCRMCKIQGVTGRNGGMFFPGMTRAYPMNTIQDYQNPIEEVSKNMYLFFWVNTN
jgi:hypothetical protein